MSRNDFSPEPGSRWALFGGVFDPPHNGHLALALSALEHGNVNGVAFLVSAVPPHKEQPKTSFADRVSLVSAHIVENSYFKICDIEKEMAPPGYTIHVIEKLQERFPGVEFSVIIGSDNLAILEKWYQINQLLEKVTMLVASRAGVDAAITEKWRERVRFIPLAPYPVSSTEIRQKVCDGESIEGLTSSGVIEYIQVHELYRKQL